MIPTEIAPPKSAPPPPPSGFSASRVFHIPKPPSHGAPEPIRPVQVTKGPEAATSYQSSSAATVLHLHPALSAPSTAPITASNTTTIGVQHAATSLHLPTGNPSTTKATWLNQAAPANGQASTSSSWQSAPPAPFPRQDPSSSPNETKGDTKFVINERRGDTNVFIEVDVDKYAQKVWDRLTANFEQAGQKPPKRMDKLINFISSTYGRSVGNTTHEKEIAAKIFEMLVSSGKVKALWSSASPVLEYANMKHPEDNSNGNGNTTSVSQIFSQNPNPTPTPESTLLPAPESLPSPSTSETLRTTTVVNDFSDVSMSNPLPAVHTPTAEQVPPKKRKASVELQSLSSDAVPLAASIPQDSLSAAKPGSASKEDERSEERESQNPSKRQCTEVSNRDEDVTEAADTAHGASTKLSYPHLSETLPSSPSLTARNRGLTLPPITIPSPRTLPNPSPEKYSPRLPTAHTSSPAPLSGIPYTQEHAHVDNPNNSSSMNAPSSALVNEHHMSHTPMALDAFLPLASSLAQSNLKQPPSTPADLFGSKVSSSAALSPPNKTSFSQPNFIPKPTVETAQTSSSVDPASGPLKDLEDGEVALVSEQDMLLLIAKLQATAGRPKKRPGLVNYIKTSLGLNDKPYENERASQILEELERRQHVAEVNSELKYSLGPGATPSSQPILSPTPGPSAPNDQRILTPFTSTPTAHPSSPSSQPSPQQPATPQHNHVGGSKQQYAPMSNSPGVPSALASPPAPADLGCKSSLNVLLSKHGIPFPSYVVTNTLGPPHNRHFEVTCFINQEEYAVGVGPSKVAAEREASRRALEKFEALHS
mmetsp:Transcript_15029/g.24741  ORF Transcript_15029/g.24741 Transcript_15029/m.24741 type:complete len:821 (+) Transcript_15029:335-2797(+)